MICEQLGIIHSTSLLHKMQISTTNDTSGLLETKLYENQNLIKKVLSDFCNFSFNLSCLFVKDTSKKIYGIVQ